MFFLVEVDNDGFKVLDSAGDPIDPAEDATVAAITTELQAIQATTGIKSIIDPLPAGTNNIGDVDIASALPAGSNIIGKVNLVDSAGINLLAIDSTGRLAIQNPPNLDAALSTRATEVTLSSFRGDFNSTDFATQTTLAALLVAFNNEDFATQTTLGDLLTSFNAEDFSSETTLAAAKSVLDTIDAVLDSIKDVDGVKKITDELPAGTQEIGLVAQGTKASNSDAWPVTQVDNVGNPVTVINDAGIYRQAIIGKVAVVGAAPPPSTTEVPIFANVPLVVGTHDTVYTIPNGSIFHLQSIIAGNEDPTKGASVEIIFNNEGTERLVRRVYMAGFSVEFGFADVNESQDGFSLVGNAGGTNQIIVRRAKFSGSNIAINAVVSGYVV